MKTDAICTAYFKLDGSGDYPLLQYADYGADRNPTGSKEIHFPVRLCKVSDRTRPALAGDRGTIILLPEGWSACAIKGRHLEIEDLTFEAGEGLIFSGANFAILIGEIGARATFLARSYEKAGKWSKWVEEFLLVEFLMEFLEEIPNRGVAKWRVATIKKAPVSILRPLEVIKEL
jgi:hypothetical protein